MNYGLMRRPVNGEPLQVKDYFKGHVSLHAWGILGGAIWGIGTIANFVASYVPMIGPATSFSLGEGQHDDLRHLGHFCVEGISRRGKPGQGSPRDYVSVLSIGTELYSARPGDPLGKRTLQSWSTGGGMTKSDNKNGAFGQPGIRPRWTHGGKEGVGTAYAASSQIWFTLWNGIITEVYYPTVDRPQLRDLQYLITDGKSFFP